MQKLALAFAAAVPALAFSTAARAECGSLTIASMNWQSAEVLASLDQFILNEGYGCDAEVTVGDTVPAITSLVEKGSPEIIPEGWVGLMPELFEKGLAEGKIVSVGKALSDGGVQGWFMPKFIQDEHPEIRTVADVLKHPELFPAPEDPSKGAIFTGPQGWGGNVITTQLAHAFGAEDHGFTLVDPGSAAGHDGAVARAYERHEGWVGYYWAPTALLGKYEMVKLDFGVPLDMAEWKRCTSVADCADPKPNSWPTDEVLTLVAKEFAETTDPAVIDYLKKRSWSNDTVNALMAWMTENQATGEDGAREFLKTHPEIWTQWVSPEAAETIKAAL
ncbi:ABC transporter substrate-binding protein [Paracoccus yeei]|uniref:ABC transporter substrate-binding protein n=1 Tax=Paracoccus yeei TaxID=147645 RepID=A0A386UJB4_9RHOB|nr:ABC transporter substrate-binding protein [Paracoccus yeei]AYF00763.1 ABC transporter substrate-binding protein [Paracoccus yeei]